MSTVVTKTVKHHLNLGGFEFIELEASVQTEVGPDETTEAALDRANAAITEHLTPDLAKVSQITANDDTYVDELIDRPRRRRASNRRG